MSVNMMESMANPSEEFKQAPTRDVIGSAECCSLADGPLEQQEAQAVATQFKALSDPTRLRMLSLLAAGGCRPTFAGELVVPLGVSQPTVSHHLKVLAEVGLLSKQRKGRNISYQVIPAAFGSLQRVLDFS